MNILQSINGLKTYVGSIAIVIGLILTKAGYEVPAGSIEELINSALNIADAIMIGFGGVMTSLGLFHKAIKKYFPGSRIDILLGNI